MYYIVKTEEIVKFNDHTHSPQALAREEEMVCPGGITSRSALPRRGRDALTRQLSFLCNNFQFAEGEDPGNKCILIPRYRATGRVAPNGKRYPAVTRENEHDYVPVRSIITKSTARDYVTPDLVNDYGYKDVQPGSGFGIALATGFSEATTQQ